MLSSESIESDEGAGAIRRRATWITNAFPGFDISVGSSLAGRSVRLAPLLTDRNGRAVGVAPATQLIRASAMAASFSKRTNKVSQTQAGLSYDTDDRQLGGLWFDVDTDSDDDGCT